MSTTTEIQSKSINDDKSIISQQTINFNHDNTTQQHAMTFSDALMDNSNRDTLMKLFVWCSILFTLPMCVLYVTYNLCTRLMQYDNHISLSISGM